MAHNAECYFALLISPNQAAGMCIINRCQQTGFRSVRQFNILHFLVFIIQIPTHVIHNHSHINIQHNIFRIIIFYRPGQVKPDFIINQFISLRHIGNFNFRQHNFAFCSLVGKAVFHIFLMPVGQNINRPNAHLRNQQHSISAQK